MIKDKGYYIGGGMLSSNGDLFYLNIPKNASTYLTNVLKDNNWSHCNLYQQPGSIKTTIAFIRDPIDRWCSGFATYAALSLFGHGYGSDHFIEDYNDLSERIIFNKIVFDDHTDLQIKYITQILDLDPVFFRFNNNIIKQMNSFLHCDLNVNINVDSNKSDDNYDTKQISRFMRNKLEQNPNLKARVIECYEQDYKFINSIEFYNDPR
jgi:hypothetical protein